MKKILALVLALVMALGLVACGDKGGEQQEGGTPNTTGEEKVVKIGVFEPLTGDNGAGGKQEILGMQYANYVQPTVEIGGADINNYGKYDYGSPTLQEAFALSSNTAFGQLGVEVGAKNLVKYCNAFGFGQTLGQDFSCKASVMPDPSEMTDWETAWSACGQPVGQHASPAGPQLTVMQNAVTAAAIANGGVVMNPYVVEHVLSPEGTVTSTTQAKSLGQAISADTASKVKDAMADVVDHGTGTRAQIRGVKVAGKTGTTTSDNDRWFAGFTPYYTGVVWCGYDDPEEVVLTDSTTNPAVVLWQKVMATLHQDLPNINCHMPRILVSVSVS